MKGKRPLLRLREDGPRRAHGWPEQRMDGLFTLPDHTLTLAAALRSARTPAA